MKEQLCSIQNTRESRNSNTQQVSWLSTERQIFVASYNNETLVAVYKKKQEDESKECCGLLHVHSPLCCCFIPLVSIYYAAWFLLLPWYPWTLCPG
jgi:hypothetical protein